MSGWIQHFHENSDDDSGREGAGQAVVELCDVTSQGVVLWSRRPFPLGAELMLRVKAAAVRNPAYKKVKQAQPGWVELKGLVVHSQPCRRPDGSVAFKLSIFIEQALDDQMEEVPLERLRLAAKQNAGKLEMN